MTAEQKTQVNKWPSSPNDVSKGIASNASRPNTGQVWHIIAGEYPPQLGGVSDYTLLVASALAERGDRVHVWCPPCAGATPAAPGVVVHRELGKIAPADLRKIGEQLDRFEGPRKILVQWVPHGFGYQSMNMPFCWWLRTRAARHGDRVDIMLHEPFLDFRASSIRQSAAAFVHRLMTVVLLRSAERVWMSIPGWEQRWRPFALGRDIPFQWLPIPSSIPVRSEPARALEIRRRYTHGDRCLIGHFGTFGWPITSELEPILFALCREPERQAVLFLGLGSEEFRRALILKEPAMERLIQATGPLPAEEVSLHLAACDLMIQPYPDGVSTRRTSCMAPLSHGKPIVTTHGTLTEDFWLTTGAALTAKAGDTAAFVELVRRLRDNSEEREKLGRVARELYRERFEVSRVVEALRAAARPA